MSDARYDVVVIGGGIVGLSVAMEITRRFPRLRLLLVEKEDRVARHQSGHNSGVIHSGVYYKPGSHKARMCVEGAAAMVDFCRRNSIPHQICGKVIVATREPWQETALETIRDLGLELQIIFNKGAVMILPSGVNKASGLLAALDELAVPAVSTVAVGDAENDDALLKACGLGVAVANAVPGLLESADWIAPGANGSGVAAVAHQLLRDDFASIRPRQGRHRKLEVM